MSIKTASGKSATIYMYDTAGRRDNPTLEEWAIHGLFAAQRSNNFALARKGTLTFQWLEVATDQLNERFTKYMRTIEQQN